MKILLKDWVISHRSEKGRSPETADFERTRYGKSGSASWHLRLSKSAILCIFCWAIPTISFGQAASATPSDMWVAIMNSIWLVLGGVLGGLVVGFLFGTLVFRNKLEGSESPKDAGLGGCLTMLATGIAVFFLVWFWTLNFRIEWYWWVIATAIVLLFLFFGLKKRGSRRS
jgi:hypothetical protein